MTDDQAQAPQETADAAEVAAELERVRDRWLRARADLENYRKRSEQEIERRVREARDRLLLDCLEVLDSVDRALELSQDSGVTDALGQVHQQMQAGLARHGVERMDAKGAPFDPQIHEAVGIQHGDEAPPNTVVDVARAGYLEDGRVLRPARVIVSRPPTAEAAG